MQLSLNKWAKPCGWLTALSDTHIRDLGFAEQRRVENENMALINELKTALKDRITRDISPSLLPTNWEEDPLGLYYSDDKVVVRRVVVEVTNGVLVKPPYLCQLTSEASENLQANVNNTTKSKQALPRMEDAAVVSINAAGGEARDLTFTAVREVRESAVRLEEREEEGLIVGQVRSFAKQNPGQAVMVAAAAGFLVGWLMGGSSRR